MGDSRVMSISVSIFYVKSKDLGHLPRFGPSSIFRSASGALIRCTGCTPTSFGWHLLSLQDNIMAEPFARSLSAGGLCILLVTYCQGTQQVPPQSGCTIKDGSTVWYGSKLRHGTKFFGVKSTVRNYGMIYFPRYGTVRKYDIFFVLFFNLFRTNLIIDRRPLRYVRNQDLYRFRGMSMKCSKLYRVLCIVQKTRGPNPLPACLSSIGASYRRPSRRAHRQDFGLYMGLLIEGLDF